MPNLIIGSRGSKLALWQSNWVKHHLEQFHPGLEIEIEIIKTTGDKLTEASLVKIGGKGVFTKEIEEALLDGTVDVAVHSLKDLPTTLPDGLHLAAITEREDVRDALIVRQSLRGTVKTIVELPLGARVGTSSLRRAAQLRNKRPDLEILELRGNVETRLRKVDEGDYDAIILASAGMIRLGFGDRITAKLEPDEMLSAVGQAALGIEARLDDGRTNLLLEILNHWPTRHATEAERAVLRELGGGCAVPIAALGRVEQENILAIEALVTDVEGKSMIRQMVRGSIHQGEELGKQLAESLIEAGARELLPKIGAGSDASSSPASQPERPPSDHNHGTRAATVEDSTAVAAVESSTVTAAVESSIVAGGTKTASASVMESVTSQIDSQTPLIGKRIIVTRALKQSGLLNQALQQLGAELVACPTI